MKLRHLELREIPVPTIPNLIFSWTNILREVLTAPIQVPNGSVGITSDELAISVACLINLKEARERGLGEVSLTAEEYNYLLGRLNMFRWGFANPDVAPLALDLVKHVRGLKEEDFDAVLVKKATGTAETPQTKTESTDK